MMSAPFGVLTVTELKSVMSTGSRLLKRIVDEPNVIVPLPGVVALGEYVAS